MRLYKGSFVVALAFSAWLGLAARTSGEVRGWLNWRGPQQNGTSTEKNLPDKVDPRKSLWVQNFPGASTPVVANGKLYIMTVTGDGTELQEGVACFDAETGKLLWQQMFSDFLSDIIYRRYATSSPTVDPETGNVYMQGTQGILAAFTADGKLLWKHSLMEMLGRLTFPNGRTPAPVIDGDYVITRYITANWGAQGPAGDRFYAFDKKTGDLVWGSSPSDRPKDNSFSLPYFGMLDGKRVFYATCGDGSVVCVNARTGDPIWRVPLGKSGINASVLVHKNERIIAVYGTPYEPGQLVAFKIPKVTLKPGEPGPVVVPRSEVEVWADDLSTSTSSPILVGDRIYVVTEKGDLCCVDANNGGVLWKLKIGIEQRNSCPVFADGKIYVPMLDDPGSKTEAGSEAGTTGAFYIIKPGDKGGEILSHVALDGRCFGTPTVYNGKVYMQTTRHLYAFGTKGNNSGLPQEAAAEPWPKAGPATQLQVIPSEVLLRPGQSATFRIRSLDANGFPVEEVQANAVKWASYVPPTAKVRAALNGKFNEQGQLVAGNEPKPSAGAFEATLGNLKGYIRGRVLPYLPIKQDFEWATLTETNQAENAMFAYPPLPWIGARFKFDIREKDGNKVLAKTLDNVFFQRATVFLGDPGTKNYTIEADVMSEGNRRKMSDVGIINQRYLIVLKGNEQKLEVNSNLERLRVPAGDEPPNFKWTANAWYHLKARVDPAPDGSGTIRAKAWKKGEPEPDKWLLEVRDPHLHESGSPGLFALAPQMRVYVDNVVVTPNQ
jgi:outer membrane protein assembly factor BamB